MDVATVLFDIILQHRMEVSRSKKSAASKRNRLGARDERDILKKTMGAAEQGRVV
jgi:hypothetical protein